VAPVADQLTDEPTSTPRRRIPWRGLAAIALAGVISLAVFLAPIPWADLAGYGYLGIFLLSVLSASSVFLPLPGLALAYTGGGVLDPLIVGLVAGLGNALGELTGYLAGRGGSAIIEDQVYYQRMEALMDRYGGLVILVLAIIPNPIFDMAGIAAGVLRYPVWKFLLFCTVGKTIKTLAFAYLGEYSRDWLLWFLGGAGRLPVNGWDELIACLPNPPML